MRELSPNAPKVAIVGNELTSLLCFCDEIGYVPSLENEKIVSQITFSVLWFR